MYDTGSTAGALTESFENGMEMQTEYVQRTERFFPLHDGNNCRRTFEAIARLKEKEGKTCCGIRELISSFMTGRKPLRRCSRRVGRKNGRTGCRRFAWMLKKERMSEDALLQTAEAAKKCYLRPAADTDGWQALQPFWADRSPCFRHRSGT